MVSVLLAACVPLVGCEGKKEITLSGGWVGNGGVLNYDLRNRGSKPLTLKWVVVNRRSECLLAPSGARMQSIEYNPLDGYSETVTINIGNAVSLMVPPSCGEIVYLRLGDVDGEFEVKF